MQIPCSRLEGSRCGVYRDRPRACAEYRCLLLKKFEGGEVTLDAALATVHEFEAAVDTARERLGAFPDGAAIESLQREEEASPDPVEFRRQRAALLLAIGRLRAISLRFVENDAGRR